VSKASAYLVCSMAERARAAEVLRKHALAVPTGLVVEQEYLLPDEKYLRYSEFYQKFYLVSGDTVSALELKVKSLEDLEKSLSKLISEP